MALHRLFFDTILVDGFESLLDQFKVKDLASPYRSTVPLLSLIKDDWGAFEKILPSECDRSSIDVHIERKTRSPKGSGNESQTDALVVCPNAVVAIEAKWTEPRYETFALRRQKKDADQDFLDGWLEILRRFASVPLALSDFDEVPYQMVHRAASACNWCADAALRPYMIYLHFHELGAKNGCTTYADDLSKLHEILGNPAGFDFFLVDMPLNPTPSFEALRGLKRGAKETSDAVVAALRATKLFEFGTPSIAKVGRPKDNSDLKAALKAYGIVTKLDLVRERGLTPMSNHVDQVLRDALALAPEERAELAEHVLASLDSPQRKKIDDEWAAETEDRIDAYERGEMPTISAEDVYREYRERRKK